MKTIRLFLIASMLPLLGFSQSLFDPFENMDNVSSMVVNKNMISLVSSLGLEDGDQEAKDFLAIAQGLQSVKLFMTEDQNASKEMTRAVSKYLRSSKLEELMRVKSEDVNVKFYVREGKNESHVKELLMFISGIENVKEAKIGNKQIETILLSLTGDIDLDKISTLTHKMKLPEELNKIQTTE